MRRKVALRDLHEAEVAYKCDVGSISSFHYDMSQGVI